MGLFDRLMQAQAPRRNLMDTQMVRRPSEERVLLDEFYPPDYSKLKRGQFRRDTPQMREYAANVPVDVGRGTFAGLFGLTSDILNFAPAYSPMPMEQFGDYNYAPSQKVPYGSEYFLENLPLAPAADNPLGRVAGQLGSFAPMVPVQAARIAGKGAAATGRFVAPKAGQLAEQYMVRTGGILPLDVYHGTPHTLPPTPRNPLGEFDASKIGTGEGAQSYGLGIYTAENPAVATGYRENLSQNRLFDSRGTPFDIQENLLNLNVRAVLYKTNGDIDAAIARAKQSIESIPGTQGAEYAAKDIETLNAIKASGGLQKQSGNLYKVDLPDEMIAKMIDYDKPMAEQRNVIEKMREALVGPDSPLSRSQQFQINDYLSDSVRMRNLYPQSVVDLNDPRIVERLRQVGIPGIKYLDEGSRAAGTGTRNFVTFPGEEQNLRILERNNQRANELDYPSNPMYTDPLGYSIR